MGAEPAENRAAGPPALQEDRRRAVAVWLGLLAAWRGGLLRRIADRCGSLSEAVELPEAHLKAVIEGPAVRRRSGARPEKAAGSAAGNRDEADAQADAAAFRRVLEAGPGGVARLLAIPADVRVVAWGDEAYPAALEDLRDAPPVLFVRGRVTHGLAELERSRAVAIVGTRSASAYGLEMTRALARDLSAAGVLVISGMASGVDAAAQAAACDTWPAGGQSVSTVGVLGCGVDVVYPRANARLFEAVLRGGMLLSEFPPGVPPRAWRFPARNRVIAGLARAVVVVEGGSRSGSLYTADFAEQLGREVLAVPGEAGRRLSAGPHRLLRCGAHLCESADDVLEVIGLRDLAWSGRSRPRQIGESTGPVARALEALDAGERTIDELAAELAQPVSEAAALMAGLEVEGLVAGTVGGRYRLCRDAASSGGASRARERSQ